MASLRHDRSTNLFGVLKWLLIERTPNPSCAKSTGALSHQGFLVASISRRARAPGSNRTLARSGLFDEPQILAVPKHERVPSDRLTDDGALSVWRLLRRGGSWGRRICSPGASVRRRGVSRSSQCCASSLTSAACWTGLTMWSSNPASFDFCRSSSWPQPVRAMTLIPFPQGCSRSFRTTS